MFHIDSLSNRYLSNNVKVFGFISFATLIIRFPGMSSAPYWVRSYYSVSGLCLGVFDYPGDNDVGDSVMLVTL